MPDRSFLDWPFLDDRHRALARELGVWAHGSAAMAPDDSDASVDARCRTLVRALGTAGWLRVVVPGDAGGVREKLDVRSIALARETLAYHDGLADFSFAMQGLGIGPVALFGERALRDLWLPRIRDGESVAAFALSESEAGSDVAAMRTTARRDGDAFVIDGEKTWISNAGIADVHVVFCRFPEAGPASYVALVVERDAPGFRVRERIRTLAPHPLGTLTFDGCRVPATNLVGEAGAGLKVALATLDVFRTTVGAAALGFARRALDEAIAWTRSRHAFGQALAEFQLVQGRIADMALAVDASALLVYRAAWTRDLIASRVTREAAMAKLHATESAQRVIDDAVQLAGGRGVVAGAVVERLYREIRALRIYEGTSDIQRLLIAKELLRQAGEAGLPSSWPAPGAPARAAGG